MVEPIPRICNKNNCIVGAGVQQATLRNELGIHIANFSSKSVYIVEVQAVAKAAEHAVVLMENTITLGDMLGVVESKTVDNKRNKST